MLLRKIRAAKVLKYDLIRRASLKDIIESQGIPHTEVAQISLKKKELGFGFIPVGGEEIDILPRRVRSPTFSKALRQAITRLLRLCWRPQGKYRRTLPTT